MRIYTRLAREAAFADQTVKDSAVDVLSRGTRAICEPLRAAARRRFGEAALPAAALLHSPAVAPPVC